MCVRPLIAAVFGLVLAAPMITSAQDVNDASAHHRVGINGRERRQAARIREGRQDDQITRGELNRLRADEAAIRAEERLYRRSGDGLNRWERRDLQRDLNRTSREIYRARHNGR
jgi:hypothetical protein